MRRERFLSGVLATLALALVASCSGPVGLTSGNLAEGRALTADWKAQDMAVTGIPGTQQHDKQVIGYITQWDAWKDTKAGVPAQGAFTHLNIDYSQYTILNYSFFGVAQDGSLHSGDYRDKAIYQPGVNQKPQPLFFTDTYSSWDLHILFGELDLVQNLNADAVKRATAQGFVVKEGGSSWSQPTWGLSGSLPVPLHKEGGAPGVLELAHKNGVKVVASIGGWSMCKHFPEMAADPAKRKTFIADCVKLINTGFDGIDFDWEYPGPYSGMNFTGTTADYANFLTLMREVRAAIGPDKLVTAAMAADPKKLEGLDWVELGKVMNYYNFMTYDFNGGWSDKAGHNSPLHNYTGSEAPTFNWDSLLAFLKAKNVDLSKVSMGSPFYGRGVVTNGPAALNAPTLKRAETVQPDGPITTCADYTNWPKEVYDGTPNYDFIRQKALTPGSGWTRGWDAEAQVPYLTKGNFFLSYDDAESIGLKAQYIKQNGLAGTIVWTVYGDLEFGGSVTSYGSKLKKWSSVKSPLVNKINATFADGTPIVTYDLTSSAGANGTIAPAGKVTVNKGSSQTYTFTPAKDYAVDKVTVDGAVVTVTGNSYTFTGITAAHTIAVTFKQDLTPSFALTATAPTNGTITPAGVTSVKQGASQTYTITPASGYQIAGVTVDGASVGKVASYTFSNVTAAHTIAATFEKIVVTDPVWDPNATYASATVVTWANHRWQNKWWTKGEEPGKADVWKDLGPIGPVLQFTLTATAGTGGTISPSGAVKVNEGASQTYKITPAAGYAVADVTVGGVSVGAVTSYTVANVKADTAINATFKIDATPTFAITATAPTNGTITPAGVTNVKQGAAQTYTITPAAGYQVSAVTVDGTSVGAVTTYTFSNVTAAHSIAATFVVSTTPIWKVGVAYKLNDKVSHQGVVYVCKYAHTSNSAWVPGTPGLWMWEKV